MGNVSEIDFNRELLKVYESFSKVNEQMTMLHEQIKLLREMSQIQREVILSLQGTVSAMLVSGGRDLR